MNVDQYAFAKRELEIEGNVDPTFEEVAAYYARYVIIRDEEHRVEKLHENYSKTLEKGYLHTDGITYYSTEKAAIDMALAYSLYMMDPVEPISIIDKKGGVHALCVEDFKTLAGTIGRYIYNLRLQLWEDLYRP